MIAVFITELTALVTGAVLLSQVYGWHVGVGAACLAYVAMPVKQ